ncbi:MAG: alpha/beta hydrolase [Pseudomonadota bacterium]
MAADWPQARRLAVGDVTLSTHVAGDGPLVILLHGFPDLAITWQQLLPALVNAGFRVAAPDLRGYGASDCPSDVRAYAIDRLIGDLDGLLAALGYESACFVGHDWGALLLWQYALQRNERVDRLVTLNVPYYPRPSSDPLKGLRRFYGETHYVVDFNNSTAADAVFAADPKQFLRAMYRRLPIRRADFESRTGGRPTPFSMLHELAKDVFPGEPLLTEAELDARVAAFRQTGFTPAINWYRNWTRNWVLTDNTAQRITIPTLFVEAVDDVLVDPTHVQAMHRSIDNLDIWSLADCGHWPHLEHPIAVNKKIVRWLSAMD